MRLDQYLTGKLHTPFEWGVHDCVIFAAGWVQIATGRRVLEDLPKWDSKASAMRVIASAGGLLDAITDRMGSPITSPRDGDLALLPSLMGGVCIVSGPYIIGVAHPSGFQFYPTTNALAFWRTA